MGSIYFQLVLSLTHRPDFYSSTEVLYLSTGLTVHRPKYQKKATLIPDFCREVCGFFTYKSSVCWAEEYQKGWKTAYISKKQYRWHCINGIVSICVLTLIIVLLQIAVQRFAFFKMSIAFQNSGFAFCERGFAKSEEGLQNSNGVCKRVVRCSVLIDIWRDRIFWRGIFFMIDLLLFQSFLRPICNLSLWSGSGCALNGKAVTELRTLAGVFHRFRYAA